MKKALLIIDMQQEFFEEGRLREHREKLAENITELVGAARENGIPIIWIRQEYRADLSDAPLFNRKHKKPVTIKGTPGSRLLPELSKKPEDREIIKKRYSAFLGTKLDEILKSLRVDGVIVAGVNTMSCVRVTSIDAYQRDYEVILALDCVDAYDVEQHENSIKYLQYAVAEGKHNQEIIAEL